MQRFVCTTTAMGGRTAPCDFPLLHGGGTKIQMWVNGTKNPLNGGKKGSMWRRETTRQSSPCDTPG